MLTTELSSTLVRLFGELVNGPPKGGDAFVLNSGDAGLLRSLDKLSATDASQSVNDGATIAAHARHLQYGLSLMNRWAREGGDPFADATWDAAWKTSRVDEAEWLTIREGLAQETRRWLESLGSAREISARRTQRDDRKHRASRISPRRDQTDRQGRTRSEGRHVRLAPGPHPRALASLARRFVGSRRSARSLTPHSSRSAVTGSTRVARRAGM